MKYSFGDRTEPASRAEQIRALFVTGSTVAQHAELCVEKGVWSESELLGMASITARQEVREALGALTSAGVPFAGPTAQRSDKAPVWKQIEFWSKEDFDYNWSAYKIRELSNRRVADNIARVCLERYGEPPSYIGEPVPGASL